VSVEHAVELALDETASERVTALMVALEEAGIATIGGSSPHVHPHVSVAVVSSGTPDELTQHLEGLGRVAVELPALTLSALGFFVAPGRVVYLAVTATGPLLALNRAVHDRLAAAHVETRALYREGSWVPHCTLAMHVEDPSVAIGVLADAPLPILCSVVGLRIVEVPTGRLVASVR
jgi:hypothetical protein